MLMFSVIVKQDGDVRRLECRQGSQRRSTPERPACRCGRGRCGHNQRIWALIAAMNTRCFLLARSDYIRAIRHINSSSLQQLGVYDTAKDSLARQAHFYFC